MAFFDQFNHVQVHIDVDANPIEEISDLMPENVKNFGKWE